MNGPSPPPDSSQWFSIAEHLEGLLGLMTGAVVTAGAAVWRMAVWTTSVKAELREVLDKLNAMQETSDRRHEDTQREMDQIRLDVRADREETREHRRESREAAAALSARIDGALARRN
jgi:hypothetical protein